MSDYVRVEDFSAKDILSTGDPEKTITGADMDSELDAIVTAIASKEDSANKGIASGYCGLDGSGLVDPTDLPTATETAIGALEIATTAEAQAGTATDKIMTPDKVVDLLETPPAIGGTTPAAVTGTTVTGSAGVFTSTLTLGGVGVVTTARTITSGDGLTGGGDLSADRTLAVGAGDGISVAADAVAVDISGLSAYSAPAGTDGFLVDNGGTMNRVSFNGSALPSRDVSSSGNFASTDVGTMVYWTGTSGTLTMPTGIGQDDCYIIVINSGSGNVTLAGSGVTVNSANSLLTLPPGGVGCLIRETSTVWFAGGSLQ